ncbi:hypothetical protein PLANPX_3015 [Lacipirellula parvula]|uniref:Uncharacterized protein n=1 Tax=Lacipirellula parvula TaxID=2650471 RepID=A0A5K7XGN4_9BACT|nr:hypothetical protein PLANPX_3015 [Lacipirellula parvula]
MRPLLLSLAVAFGIVLPLKTLEASQDSLGPNGINSLVTGL